MTETMNIYQRLNAVRKKVAYVQKDAQVQGYRGVTHDMVTAVTRDAFIEYGVLIVTDQRFSDVEDVGQTSKGTTIIRYSAWYEISFVNIYSPDDKVSVRVESHANDQGDKAPGKAISYAVKSAILKILNLETGENDEGRLDAEKRQNDAVLLAKEEVDELLEQGDTLAVYLIAKRLGESWIEVYNMAPAGQKTKWKKTLSDAEKQGGELLRNINQALLDQDRNKAIENMEGMTDYGKRLLANYLGKQANTLGELIKES